MRKCVGGKIEVSNFSAVGAGGVWRAVWRRVTLSLYQAIDYGIRITSVRRCSDCGA